MTSNLTTHVLDAATGAPAGGIEVALRKASDLPGVTGALLGSGTTGADGRLELGPERLNAGAYVLTFLTGEYYGEQAIPTFYPEITVTFSVEVADDGSSRHYHVPLLLSPFAYSTYRGS